MMYSYVNYDDVDWKNLPVTDEDEDIDPIDWGEDEYRGDGDR